MNSAAADAAITRWTGDAMQSRLRKRYRSERLFRLLGLAAVGVSLAFLAFLLGTMLWKGMGGLTTDFLTMSDSTDPAMAGVWGALKGSFLTIVVTMALAFPVGVLSAIYLEEFAARNRWTDIIEVSINNLAAVPSIIFGLLGLAVFLNFMHLPRSAPLVGGLTLALMTMPVIVIAGRNAITSVPPSIREAALGVGASKMQVVFHHVLPLALPGILTGTIIGMARALGETAPLLMIGMRAFIAVPPSGITEPATVLPVQIFLWSDEVDRSFVEKTSAAIIVLLVFMLLMNAIAIYLRNRFEQRW
jgi:phosphate transport system permease protein